MEKTSLFVMCGLQCSGKSTKALELAETFDATVLSSDKIREQYPSAKNDTVFRLLYERMNDLLGKGINVVVDATNTTIKSRKQIFENLKVECDKICIIMNTPYKDCIKRLKKRNKSDYPHKFDADVIKRYYYSFEIPFYEEGWDGIFIENHTRYKDSVKFSSKLLKKAEKFDQKNKHHTQNLGDHMDSVGLKLSNHFGSDGEYINLVSAGYYHDVGKLFTQTFKDGDPNAHYYNHANVGAYELLCSVGSYNVFSNEFGDIIFEYDTDATLEWLFYINYHMHMFNITTKKAENKWRGIFGDLKFCYLRAFNEFDKAR